MNLAGDELGSRGMVFLILELQIQNLKGLQ